VWVQRGLIDRHYAEFEMLDGDKPDFGEISFGKHNNKPWQGFWRATGPWIGVPNIQQVDITKSFENNGVATATVHIENVIFQEQTGVAGIFHRIMRGFMSPMRGYRMASRPSPREAQNEWFDVLNGGCRIKIWQGYGNALEPVFCGLIDEDDVSSKPDSIIITCRDFGAMMADQDAFGLNKAADIKSPIV
jgi:hypothetical protein